MGLRGFEDRLNICGHVPGKQFVNVTERMVGGAGQHFAQPAFRIDPVEACRAQQGVDRSRALTAAV